MAIRPRRRGQARPGRGNSGLSARGSTPLGPSPAPLALPPARGGRCTGDGIWPMPNRWLTAAALLVLLPASAQAGCLYKTFEFHPEKNDGVVVDASSMPARSARIISARGRATNSPASASCIAGQRQTGGGRRQPFHLHAGQRLQGQGRLRLQDLRQQRRKQGLLGRGFRVAGEVGQAAADAT